MPPGDAAGYRLVYTPDAVVEHVAAPYAKGRRFDLRYAYWAQKNHLILLIRNFGLGAPIVRALHGLLGTGGGTRRGRAPAGRPGPGRGRRRAGVTPRRGGGPHPIGGGGRRLSVGRGVRGPAGE